MGKGKFLDFLVKHADKVKEQNKKSSRQETAQAEVFKSMKQKIKDARDGIRDQVDSKGKPIGLKERIRQKMQEARRENEEDPKVKTAPSSVYDSMDNRIEQLDRQRRARIFKQIAEEYVLDLSEVPPREMAKIKSSFTKDFDNLMKNYAYKFKKAGA